MSNGIEVNYYQRPGMPKSAAVAALTPMPASLSFCLSCSVVIPCVVSSDARKPACVAPARCSGVRVQLVALALPAAPPPRPPTPTPALPAASAKALAESGSHSPHAVELPNIPPKASSPPSPPPASPAPPALLLATPPLSARGGGGGIGTVPNVSCVLASRCIAFQDGKPVGSTQHG